MNILFVCTGNVSRSYLAEVLLRNELASRGVDNIMVSSAGIHAYEGSPPDAKVIEYLLKEEIPAKNHEARKMTEKEAEWADLILVMEKAHAEKIEESWPDVSHKVKKLSEYATAGPIVDDIIDPFSRSPYHYRLAMSQITLAIKQLAQELIQSQT